MPRNKEQNKEIRKRRREEMIRGALKVYVEKGYAAAEIGDVAERAGVARGLVYYYFKDKRTLFRELFNHMFEMSKNHVQSHFCREGDIDRLMEEFVRSMYDNIQSESSLFFLRARHDLRELFEPEELKQWNWRLEYFRTIQRALEKGMEAGRIRRISSKLLAMQFIGVLMHGFMHLRQLNEELREQGLPEEEIARQIRQDTEDAVACCMSLVSPPAGVKSNGGDKS